MSTTKRRLLKQLNVVHIVFLFISCGFWYASAAPRNDQFLDAIVIAQQNGSDEITVSISDLQAATIQHGEPESRGGVISGSVWYIWRPPFDGETLFSHESGMSLVVDAFTGTSLSSLQPVEPLFEVSFADRDWGILAPEGDRIYVRVGVVDENSLNESTLRISHVPRVLGANTYSFDKPAELPPAPFMISGSFDGQPAEPWEKALNWSTKSGVWYRWTPEQEGVYRIDATDALFAVFPAVPGELPKAPRVERGLRRIALVSVEDGVEFDIFVHTEYQDAVEERYRLSISDAVPFPVNDDFSNRIDLGTVTETEFSGYASGATLEEGESEIVPEDGGTVWWRWTAPADLRVVVSTSSASQLMVYEEGAGLDALDALDPVGVELGSNPVAFAAEDGKSYAIRSASLLMEIEEPLHFTLSTEPRPPNDLFADAELVEDQSRIQFPSGLVLGTREADEPYTLPGDPAHLGVLANSIWFQWTSTSSSYVELFESSSLGAKYRVYKGTGLGDLLSVANQLEPIFYAEAGHTYVIAVESGLGYTVELERIDECDNDTKVTARDLGSASSASDSASFIGATWVEGEPGFTNLQGEIFPGHGFPSIWWKWRAPDDMEVYFSVRERNGNTRTYFFERTANGNLIEMKADRDRAYYAKGGDDYYVVLAATIGTVGQVTLDMVTLPNDTFEERDPLAATGVTAGRNFRAKEDEGDPFSKTVWFEWNPEELGGYQIDIIGERIQSRIYTRMEDGRLSEVDSGGNSLRLGGRPGTSYFLAIGSGLEQEFAVEVQLLVEGEISNDDFANRIVLQSLNVDISQWNVGATLEEDEPSTGTRVASVWWEFSAETSGGFTADYSESDFPVRLDLFSIEGNTIASLSNLERVYALGPLVPGGRYFLRVSAISRQGGYAYEAGLIRLKLSTIEGDVNDDISSATVLPSMSVVDFRGDLKHATAEIGEPLWRVSPPARGGGTLWWKWTAPVTGIVRIETQAVTEGFSAGAMMFTGSVLDDLERQSIFGRNGTSYSVCSKGTEYWLSLRGGTLGSTPQVVEVSLEVFEDDQDLDKDGFSNLLETAFNSDPGSPASSPDIKIMPSGDAQISLPLRPRGIEISGYWSVDLRTWEEAQLSTKTLDNTIVLSTVSVPGAPPRSKFVRFRVARQ